MQEWYTKKLQRGHEGNIHRHGTVIILIPSPEHNLVKNNFLTIPELKFIINVDIFYDIVLPVIESQGKYVRAQRYG